MTAPDAPTPAQQAEQHLARIRALGVARGVEALDVAVRAWLGRALLADRWAKLDQIGRSEAEKIKLSRVFVDAARQGAEEHALGFVAEWLGADEHAPGFVAEWLRVDVGPLDAALCRDEPPRDAASVEDPESDPHRERQATAQGVVLVGGPGQGKSTLTQFLAQVHRAYWCAASDDPLHATEARTLLDDVRESLPSPTTLMLPLRFDLALTLAGLSRGESDMLSRVRDGLGVAGITVELVKDVLCAVPVLLVLDGLDEVPASGGRARVLQEVDALLATLESARGALIVTTRPQGYAREFGGLPEWTIAPWPIETARRYARRFLAQRYEDQSEERELVERRVDEACDDEGTARLMTTPLQVTMMASLVTYLGRAPRERWRLFLEYYRLILARESRKSGVVGTLLQRYERFVREIHQHVAVLLQARAELESSAPLLTRAELTAIARARLERESYPEDLRERLVAQMVEVATDRLVFVVQPREGGFGFELRALQEFFAAGALTADDDDDVVAERLAEVVRSPAWAQVLVFAVGRAMEERSPQLQERLTVGLCDLLDTPGEHPFDGVAQPGAELALRLLQDGAVLAVPRIARPLLDRALRCFELPPTDMHDRLAALCMERDVDEATGALERVLARCDQDAPRTLTAWRVLLTLAELHAPVRERVQQEWELAGERWIEIVDALSFRACRRPWLAGVVQASFERGGFPMPRPLRRFVRTRVSSRPFHEGEWGLRSLPVRLEFSALSWTDPDRAVGVWREARGTALDQQMRFSELRDAQARRRSRLARNGTWARLKLPLPGPTALSAPVVAPETEAPRPTRIAIAGLRGHLNTSIELGAPVTPHGSLLLLVGRNGTGKTTLLRALAFALAADVAGSFVTQSRAPYLHAETLVADCRVETSGGVFHAQVQRNGPAEQLVEMAAPCRPFVAAYGCRRGSALGSPERASNVGLADFIDNLFDRPSGLTRAETWLHTLKPGAQDDAEATARYKHVVAQLLALLPGVSAIHLEGGEVRVTLADDAKHPVLLEALSDGYLTTLGWVIDLMALWTHWCTKVLKRPLPPDFCAVMSGYVLLDEIDLHLHPAWQTRVLADVRRMFPRMHFIATTHNPLTLVGARATEVRRLVRDEESGGVRAEEVPYDPRLKTGGELYEHFFGIEGLYPAELGKALQEYSYLAGDPDRSDAEEARMQAILEQFRREDVDPGWAPVPRETPRS